SLALPIGLHLSWNWTQGCLLGFDVSGMNVPGWLHPVLQQMPGWITGGKFGPEASLGGVIADVVMLAVIWKWVGTGSGAGQGQPSESAVMPTMQIRSADAGI